MIWRRLALLLAVAIGAAAGGCDGGSSGTGITTAEGNIVSIGSPTVGASGAMSGAAQDGMVVVLAGGTPSAADDSLAGIEVSVEGTKIWTKTDSSGAFRMQGDFDSQVTFLFERSSDGLSAHLSANVPAGGTLTMTNVHIDNAQGVAVPQKEEVEFAGLISAIDCPAGRLVLVSAQKPMDADEYVVLLDGSTVRDASGAAVACDALFVGESAQTSAIVNPDGTFGDATIVVGGM